MPGNYIDIPQIVLHHNTLRNSDGSCQRWWINGRMKIWKRQPNRFQIPVKRGLYEFNHITNENASHYHLEEDCEQARMSSPDVQVRSFRLESQLGISEADKGSGRDEVHHVRAFSMPYPSEDDTRGFATKRGRYRTGNKLT